jgi:hypothetical protein
MTDIVLTPITSGYNLAKINANFDKVQDVVNNEVVHSVGGNNVMHQNLDMNSFSLLNVSTDAGEPGSLLTVVAGDERYYNITGDTLQGAMQVAGNKVTGLAESLDPTDAVRKQELTDEVNARAAGDASLQDQLVGVNPPMGSAFSMVSWHDQIITNSITIPANKNAWSFGPTITVASGQIVEIGAGSFWTIANGATTGSGTINPEIPNVIDMGVLL